MSEQVWRERYIDDAIRDAREMAETVDSRVRRLIDLVEEFRPAPQPPIMGEQDGLTAGCGATRADLAHAVIYDPGIPPEEPDPPFMEPDPVFVKPHIRGSEEDAIARQIEDMATPIEIGELFCSGCTKPKEPRFFYAKQRRRDPRLCMVCQRSGDYDVKFDGSFERIAIGHPSNGVNGNGACGNGHAAGIGRTPGAAIVARGVRVERPEPKERVCDRMREAAGTLMDWVSSGQRIVEEMAAKLVRKHGVTHDQALVVIREFRESQRLLGPNDPPLKGYKGIPSREAGCEDAVLLRLVSATHHVRQFVANKGLLTAEFRAAIAKLYDLQEGQVNAIIQDALEEKMPVKRRGRPRAQAALTA